jgi:deoxyadenosine/deoxycytidine kinase
MKIFVIGGCAGSGKSTFGNLLKEELKDYGYKPCVMQITSPLYSYAENYFNYDPNKDPKPREFLQKMGIEIIKEKLGKKDFLLNRLYEDIEILSTFFDVFIITDARLINEFLSIKAKYNDVVTIKLNRRDYNNNLNDEEKNHITEKEISMYNDFDYIIENRGLDSLKEETLEIVHNIEMEG